MGFAVGCGAEVGTDVGAGVGARDGSRDGAGLIPGVGAAVGLGTKNDGIGLGSTIAGGLGGLGAVARPTMKPVATEALTTAAGMILARAGL